MGWARLDDGWHDHPKIIAAGLDGAGLFAMCLTWAHRARKTSPVPGVVPREVIARFAAGKAKRLTARLVEVHLFDAEASGGFPIHDFDEYLPKYSADQAREAGSRGGRARAANRSAFPSEPLSEPLDDRYESEQRTSSTRASARRNPVPVPIPEPDGSGSDEPTAPSTDLVPSAQTLVAEWIDHCGTRPPSRVVGQVSKELGVMLAEGIGFEDVRRGLAAWHLKALHPSTLASVVHETRQGPRQGRSTADDRVATIQALKDVS